MRCPSVRRWIQSDRFEKQRDPGFVGVVFVQIVDSDSRLMRQQSS